MTVAFLFGALRRGNKPLVLPGDEKIAERQKSLPCVKGGGFCEAKDGGIVGYGVTVAVIIIKLKTQSLSRLRRQLPLHKGAYI